MIKSGGCKKKSKQIVMEAVAKHEFNATAADELSFKRNQVLKVVWMYAIIYPLCTICGMLFLDPEHGG